MWDFGKIGLFRKKIDMRQGVEVGGGRALRRGRGSPLALSKGNHGAVIAPAAVVVSVTVDGAMNVRRDGALHIHRRRKETAGGGGGSKVASSCYQGGRNEFHRHKQSTVQECRP